MTTPHTTPTPRYDPRRQNPSGPPGGWQEPPTSGRSALVYALAAVGFVLLVVLVVFVSSQLPRRIPAPTAYTQFTQLQQTFTCGQPAGWTATIAPDDPGLGAWHAGVHQVAISSGDARIVVTTYDIQLLDDEISGAPSMMVSPGVSYNQSADPGEVVRRLHWYTNDHSPLNVEGYAEYAKPTVTLPELTNWDAAEWYEWRASGRRYSFPHALHGYGFFAAGGKSAVAVQCVCPAESWPALEPAFRRVITTIAEPPGTVLKSQIRDQIMMKEMQSLGKQLQDSN